jgi:hypothetical protein
MVACVVGGCVMLALWLATPGAALAARWSIQRARNPAGTTDSDLFGVSCASRTSCMAVGDVVNHAGTGLTLAERWNGVTWSIRPTPDRAIRSGLLGGLEDVSCISAMLCTATGSADALIFAVRWDGMRWSTQGTPNHPDGSDLMGVSCTSMTFCSGVGWDLSGGTVVERWDGMVWSRQEAPSPPGAADITLYGVSCMSMTACTAVGNYTSGRATLPLAERWDGITWSIQATASPARAKNITLSGVSCASMTACTAVGDYTSRDARVPLAERWNGATWSIQRTPRPARAKDIALAGVSCASMTASTAVGSYTSHGAAVPLAERWNGATWSIQRTPRPARAKDLTLAGVSCATATACTAVGSLTNRAGTTVPVAERYS